MFLTDMVSKLSYLQAIVLHLQTIVLHLQIIVLHLQTIVLHLQTLVQQLKIKPVMDYHKILACGEPTTLKS